MVFKPGDTKPANSGRKKGVSNKAKVDVQTRLEDLGCDPIAGMAQIAKQALQNDDPQLAGAMYKELAQYIAPKQKAIQHSGEIGVHEMILDDLE